MTKLHAGGKFGGGSYAASGGLHGVGASVVNALSARLDVEVDRGGHTHAISFRRGVPGAFAALGPDAKFEAGSGLRRTKKIPKTRSGTRVRYWADRQIFLKDAKPTLETLHQRARQTAFLVPGLTIVVRDETGLGDGGSKGEESFRFDGGISEFCEFLATDKAVCDTLRFTGQGTFKETVPVLDEYGPDDTHRGDPRARRRRRDALGDRLRHDAPVVRQHHRHPQGGHPCRRLRAGRRQDGERGAAHEEDAARGRGRHRQGRRPGGPHGGRHRPPGRAAVRGPDQGGPRHLGGPPHRQHRDLPGAQGLPDLHQARCRPAGPRGPGEGGRRGPDPHRRPSAQGRPAPQDGPGVLLAARQAGRLPQRRRRAQRAVHRRGRLRPRYGEARAELRVPGAAADPGQDPQRSEVVRDGHAEERGVRGDHPGHRGRIRADVRYRRGSLRQDHHDDRRRWWTAPASAPCS
ncbi:DNA gyrase subunit B [Streptomyces hirsutus]